MSEIRGPVHVLGIGGMHMSAIAQLLLEQGVAVTGCDLQRSELVDAVERRGAIVWLGHDPSHVAGARLLVRTAAVPEDHPEVVAARAAGVDVLVRADMVARLVAGRRLIAVAGSHGKTTTSSLIATLLADAGRHPMYLLGGECVDLGGHAAWGGPECVVEADEYKNAFLAYEPDIAIVTNVDPDHLDFFGTPEGYADAFRRFVSRVKGGGTVILCADDAGARELRSSVPHGVAALTYGFSGGADWRISSFEPNDRGASFVVRTPVGDTLGVAAPVPGEHFARNATAALAALATVGVDLGRAAARIATFRGARRRLERVGERDGVLVYDDYAHHPNEVRATLRTLRRMFPGRRLVGVHQPHTYTRIAYLWDEWLRCWEGLDALVILETYAAREQPVAGRGARDLAEAIRTPPAQYAATFEEAAKLARELAGPDDVIVTIGAGDVFEVGRLIVEGKA